MKKMTFTFAVVLFVIYVPLPLVSQSLDWQIQFLRGRNRESTPINRAIRMENGDAFVLVIQADSDCHCCIICYDSEQQIDVLYNQAVKGGSEIHFDPVWLAEPSGTETLYVIMSIARHEELEKLIKLNENSRSRQTNGNLYREVVRLQNAASGLGEPAAAIISSGGTSRGPSDGQGFATKFSGKEAYVRAITIRH